MLTHRTIKIASGSLVSCSHGTLIQHDFHAHFKLTGNTWLKDDVTNSLYSQTFKLELLGLGYIGYYVPLYAYLKMHP